jgi:hypothetical protein
MSPEELHKLTESLLEGAKDRQAGTPELNPKVGLFSEPCCIARWL